MASEEKKVRPPTGFSRLLFRLPIWLYRMGLGWILGKRFLLLNHVGRVSGKARQAVLEVADYNKAQNNFLVASGYGKKSDWYLNVRERPDVTIQFGKQQFTATAELLSSSESGQSMVEYARRYPKAARNLSRMIGFKVDGSEETYRRIGQDHIPFVRIHCS